MSFRARLALVAAAAVALAVVLASVVVYVVVRDQLRAPVDDSLKGRAADISRVPLRAFQAGDRAFLERGPGLGGAPGYIQVVTSDGDAIRAPDATVELLRSSGVAVRNGPIDRPWGQRTAAFADPDGHIWEVAQTL